MCPINVKSIQKPSKLEQPRSDLMMEYCASGLVNMNSRSQNQHTKHTVCKPDNIMYVHLQMMSLTDAYLIFSYQ
jgi:hypothetical protein